MLTTLALGITPPVSSFPAESESGASANYSDSEPLNASSSSSSSSSSLETDRHVSRPARANSSLTASVNPENCHHALQLLLAVHAFVLMVCLILECLMVRIALKGTMWNFAPRQLMEYVLYARLRKYRPPH
jgi:hypothetical protein